MMSSIGLSEVLVVSLMFGLPLLIGIAITITVVLLSHRQKRERLADSNGDGQKPKRNLDIILLAATVLVAVSIFAGLDILANVSLYLRFVVVYVGFWVLVGALVHRHRSLASKLVILIIFLVLITVVYFVPWNSRKPFLKALFQVEEGMTEAQVDWIMEDFDKYIGPYVELNEQGEVWSGAIAFTHTDEGWGDADIGEITFEGGRVIQVRFLPD